MKHLRTPIFNILDSRDNSYAEGLPTQDSMGVCQNSVQTLALQPLCNNNKSHHTTRIEKVRVS